MFTLQLTDQLQVRLVGGSNELEGRVEVFASGQWGTVCDDGWGLTDASVVCRMLGYQRAVGAPLQAYFGSGTGLIYLDDVDCIGSETNIGQCRHRGLSNHDCRHSEDASVICLPGICSEENICTLRL